MADVLRRTPPGFVITEFSSFPPKNRAAIAEKVAKLEKKVFPAIEHFNYDVELKKKNIGLLLVFKESDADTLAAYLVYQRMKRIAWLHKLCVVEQEREKGLGKSLIHSLRRHMEKGGCHTIFFAVKSTIFVLLREGRQGDTVLPYCRDPSIPSSHILELSLCPEFKVFPASTRTRVMIVIANLKKMAEPGRRPFSMGAPSSAWSDILWTCTDGEFTCNGEVSRLYALSTAIGMCDSAVARIGAPFSFQFAPTTFSSTSENLQYSLVGNPSWLSLDGDSRTLSGTPQSDDIGTASFKINAAGQGGAVASMDSQLLISAADEPTAKDDVSAALSAVGEASRHNTVTVKPSKPFNISFPSDTFDSHGIALSYFALLENRTPLPAWISFDSSSISFGGTTSPTTYPQTIQMVLITSEAPGFSASTVSFTMVVSEHTLVFKPSSQSINVAQGQSVQINDLKKDLFLDGSNVDGKDLHSVTAELPFWLGLNNDTITITGTAPTQLKWQDIVVTAKAQSGDIAEYTVHVNVQSKTTMGDVGPLNLTLVPTNFTPQGVQCSLRAVSDQGSNTDSQTFQIMVSKAATTDPQNTPGSTNSWEHSNDRRKTAIIVGAVIGGIFGVIILVAFAVCLKRRRRLAKSYVSPKLPRSPRKSEISQPIFMPWHECDDTVEQNDEKNKENHDPFVSRTPEHPPRLDLNLPKYCFHGSVDLSGNNQQSTTTTNRHQSAMAGTHTSRSHTHSPHLLEEREDGHSLAGPIGDDDMRTLDHFQTSSFGIYDDTAPSQHSPDSMRIPTELAKRASQSSDTFRKHKRRTTTVHQDQIHRSTGLPVNRRITEHGIQRNYAPHDVRVVPASRRSSFVGGRTVGEKRNSYIRKRASNQSPFFSAGARASTCSYKSPPAFITEATSTPRSPLSPRNRNTVVRPDDDVGAGAEKDITDTPKLGELFGDQAGSPKFKFPGSLRKNRVNRPHTATSPPRDRVVKSYVRPGTAISSDRGSIVRRASTRHSFRVYDLKASLNDLTGSKVFEDAEMSDNVYSDEERDIEETEKRETIKPNEYTLPPLNLDKVDTTRNEKRGSKTAKRNSQSNTK
ncbi:acetyltransferase [Pyrenophora tritici-repentis Pt-1C-BFP]|uniref:Acetyltransferase n=1 Tax=Pyrenophora tritici-repentis (strain Pt-1C-BFP) TaxID=426418 RepID=B2W1T3_PYRTR|nr:acetyltransferase [Pyrenophora tritici-repentis Pt-1C-BFP]EDU47256.1 acetyltransferase [Pyrenophora tritici-repentis Pt-1C-BFP]